MGSQPDLRVELVSNIDSAKVSPPNILKTIVDQISTKDVKVSLMNFYFVLPSFN